MNGLELYAGPSLIDDVPIVVIALPGGRGTKTGPVINTYILRADIPPGEAMRTGQDVSICGDCTMRGEADPNWKHPSRGTMGRAWGRTCYVHIPRGPTVVWNAWKKGRYPPVQDVYQLRALMAEEHIRIGTYGDPGAVPLDIWLYATEAADAWTGFTHRWRHLDAEQWAPLLMASVDTPAEHDQAILMGWRTYRVKQANEPVLVDELVCPGSHEVGQKTTCKRCCLCDGTARNTVRVNDIVIDQHGTNERHKRSAL